MIQPIGRYSPPPLIKAPLKGTQHLLEPGNDDEILANRARAEKALFAKMLERLLGAAEMLQ
jgi:hypothetical protein